MAEDDPLLAADVDVDIERHLAGAADEVGLPMRRSLCCRHLHLLEFPDNYVFRSSDPHFINHGFSISRSDGVIRPLSGACNSSSSSKVSTVYGIAGIIKFLGGTFVLLITSHKEVGTFGGFSVYLVKSMRFLPCNEGFQRSTSQEKRDTTYFLSLLRTIESVPGLYYSYERDLTLNLQITCKMTKERFHSPLWKQADPRFVWNHSLLEELMENKLDAFAIPLLQGSFRTVEFTIKDSYAKLTLISRRCNRRLGTRMWRRGANLGGSTANFIETEQLLECKGCKSSFLQIRGSIPLLWEQIVDLSYKPRVNIIAHDETPRVVELHFHDVTQRYGNTMAINLTDKHGDEGRLSNAYAKEMKKLPHIRYVSFDFHISCKNGNFDNLELLYDQIKDDVADQGYFLIDAEGNVIKEQSGIIRTNCIDCLDRTNVTQSYLARKLLNSQLQKIGVFSSSDCISMHNDIFELFKILWAEHGDEISLEYAGTAALKGDLVRYGKQTLAGLFKDGISALSRYYLNNFQDGVRQDALDLISDRYNINRGCSTTFQLNGFEPISYLPVASTVILGGLTLTTWTLNHVGHGAHYFLSSVIWVGLTAGVIATVKANGREFCSRPRLCGLR